ncbi:methyltransferase domain-containing protein [Methylocystis echinoides]|uniref:methyltransferase domain-containing protein n=1 Tax=Methylocystis echinoides TaxID=29468 RepID=UPI00343F44D8
MTGNIGSGFRSVDGELFSKLLHCLDFMNELAFFKAYKSHSWRSLLIAPEQVILDVACGTGSDLIHLAEAYRNTNFVGVDNSEKFLAIARERAACAANLKFMLGDGHRLPLVDHSVDAARIDRSLQHMENPEAVLAEMVRVTKRGGRIVTCEPDWETFVLFNGEFDDSSKIAGLFKRSIRNPFIGRELASLMNECGVKHLDAHVHTFWTNKLNDADVIFDLNKVKDQCAAAGMMTQDDADTWWALSKQASERDTFFASLCIMEVSGTTE